MKLGVGSYETRQLRIPKLPGLDPNNLFPLLNSSFKVIYQNPDTTTGMTQAVNQIPLKRMTRIVCFFGCMYLVGAYSSKHQNMLRHHVGNDK